MSPTFVGSDRGRGSQNKIHTLLTLYQTVKCWTTCVPPGKKSCPEWPSKARNWEKNLCHCDIMTVQGLPQKELLVAFVPKQTSKTIVTWVYMDNEEIFTARVFCESGSLWRVYDCPFTCGGGSLVSAQGARYKQVKQQHPVT